MDLWSCQELAQKTRQASESLLLGSPHGLTLHVKEKRLSTLPPNHLASSEASNPLSPGLVLSLEFLANPFLQTPSAEQR